MMKRGALKNLKVRGKQNACAEGQDFIEYIESTSTLGCLRMDSK